MRRASASRQSHSYLHRGLLFALAALVLSLAGAQAERPAWQALELRDARTGEVFTLGSFAGRTVYVEPMATWCANCRRQLQNLRAAQDALPEDTVLVALSVEGALSDEALAAYAAREGFDFVFAVAPTELLAALVEQFGRGVTVPPATPHFLIRPDGSTSDLVTGIESPEALLEFVSSR